MARTDLEARELAQMVLGAVSLVLWFAVAFGLAIAWQVTEDQPKQIMLAGGIALVVAALPWLSYHRLVSRSKAGRKNDPAPRG
jgi:hypothetical protein